MGRRSLVIGLALVSWLLCLRAPGLLELYRRVPLIGLSDTVRFGGVSALMLALLAGEAVRGASRTARVTAALVLASLAGALAWERPLAPLPEGRVPRAEADELVGFLRLPADVLAGETAPLEGWFHPELPVARAQVSVQRLDAEGEPVPGDLHHVPAILAREPTSAWTNSGAALPAEVPEGATFFHAPYLQTNRLGRGHWLFAVELFTDDGDQPADSRNAQTSRLDRPGGASRATLLIAALSLALLVLAPVRGGWSWLFAALALVHGLVFAEDQNPAIPSAEVFPPTRTEAVVAEVLGDGRFFSEPGVMPPDTGLVRGLRALDGYDGMDLESYNAYRSYAMASNANGLLGWHSRGVDLDSPAFRILGARVLVLRAPLDHPDWEQVAGPGHAAEAECFVYRARDPLPRAFIVPEVLAPEELLARDLSAWDPLEVACLSADWRPRETFSEGRVDELEFLDNNRVRLRASLDGDGLLVLCEQYFPGWEVEIDGRDGEIYPANALFRGVPLEAGEHEIVFTYRPGSFWLGLIVSGGAWIAIVALFLGGRARAAKSEGNTKPWPATTP